MRAGPSPELWISTDDERIRDAAQGFGAEVVMTAEDHESGSDRVAEVVDTLRAAGNDYDVVVKYEIENFKDQAVVLDLAEDMRALRSEVRGDTGRQVEWVFGDSGTLKNVDDERSTSRRRHSRMRGRAW